MTEHLSSERDLPVVRDTQGSSEIATPSTKKPGNKTRKKGKTKKKGNKTYPEQTNNWKWYHIPQTGDPDGSF